MTDMLKMSITYNLKDEEESVRKQLIQAIKTTSRDHVENFFGVSRQFNGNGWATTKGQGLVEIEEMVLNKWCDPKFKETLNRIFEENYERIFLEAMEKAIQHHANNVAFGLTKQKKGS